MVVMALVGMMRLILVNLNCGLMAFREFFKDIPATTGEFNKIGSY